MLETVTTKLNQPIRLSRNQRYTWAIVSWLTALTMFLGATSAGYYREREKRKDLAERYEKLNAAQVEAVHLKRELEVQLAGLDAIHDKVWHGYVETDASGNIIKWNDYMTLLTGYSREEALGSNVTTIIPERMRPDHTDRYKTNIEKGRLEQTAIVIRCNLLTKAGNEKPCQVTAYVIRDPDDNKAKRAMAIVDTLNPIDLMGAIP
jgi:PAS domain S-box-containing protein